MSSTVTPSHPAGSEASLASGYELHSDLAQYCFPGAIRDEGQGLAWVNSVCALFLCVGLIGLTRPTFTPLPPPPVDDHVATIFDLPPLQEQVQDEIPPEEVESPSDATETPQVVTIVAANPNQASFAVPVRGPVAFAPAHLASAPPLTPPKRQPVAARGPVLFSQAGQGNTPWPTVYPPEAHRAREQGTVWIEFKVETNGVPFEILVLETSGYSSLDKFSADWIKRRWSFPSGENRHHKVQFIWQLK